MIWHCSVNMFIKKSFFLGELSVWSSVFNFHIREQYFHVNCRFLIIMNWEIFVGSQIYHWVAVQFSFSKRKKLHFSLVAREDTKSKRGWEDGFIDLDHLHGETKCKIIKAHLLKISLEFWLFYFFENWIVFWNVYFLRSIDI